MGKKLIVTISTDCISHVNITETNPERAMNSISIMYKGENIYHKLSTYIANVQMFLLQH